MEGHSELRIDPLTGAQVQVVATRQGRPNLPTSGCPFCVGGTESPEPYEAKAFTNRWPSFPDDRCEVILYSPDHDATLTTMADHEVRRVVDLWADRTASLGSRPDIAYVLIFENHGPEVGATITHPHGQLFAYPEVPPLPAAELTRLDKGHALLEDRADLVVVERDGWRVWVPAAAVHPYQMRVAPLEPRPDLPSLTDHERDAFGSVLVDALARMEALFEPSPPYLMWLHQRPTDGAVWPKAWMHAEIAGPQRAPGVMRFVAAGELGSGMYVNPVAPEAAADALRAAGT